MEKGYANLIVYRKLHTEVRFYASYRGFRVSINNKFAPTQTFWGNRDKTESYKWNTEELIAQHSW